MIVYKSGKKKKMDNYKKLIAISGINLFQGGPLSIYYDFLDNLIANERVLEEYEIYAFVHKKSLFTKYFHTKIVFFELPKSRKNYIYRLYYEYIYFKRFSKNIDVDIWISLHDITPNVKAKKLITYFHNPSPFRKISKMDLKTGLKNVLFPLFYKFIYRINIKKNTFIIVQQQWIRDRVKEMFHVSNVVVSLPEIKQSRLIKHIKGHNEKVVFFYPALPRSFKNIEVLCESAKRLSTISPDAFRVILTIDGTENRYSRLLKKKYDGIKEIMWLGMISRDEVFGYYNKCSCLVFPSFIETWGLPISEYKQTGKGMLVADLPYAHETVGDYDKVSFFNPYSCDDLYEKMNRILNNVFYYSRNKATIYQAPFFNSWTKLIEYIIGNKK